MRNGEYMKAIVTVMLKNGVLDPQGKAVEGALAGLGFSGIGSVRIGKCIELNLDATNNKDARAQVDAICKALLVNPVIESYAVDLKPTGKVG